MCSLFAEPWITPECFYIYRVFTKESDGFWCGDWEEAREKETKKYICLTFFFSGKKTALIFSGPLNILAKTEGLFLRLASDNNLMLS